MASRRVPEFEPVFGSRATEAGLEPRRRDRHAHIDEDPGGSVSELVENVEAHRTVGDDSRPFSKPNARRGEPVLPDRDETSTPRQPGHGPVIPDEMVEAQARSADYRQDTTPANDTGGTARVGSRWFRFRRRFVAACGVVIAVTSIYFVVSLLQVWSTGRSDDAGPAHAIVVMGAAQYDGRPSPQLAARLDHVVELWPQGVAPLVVVTGGNIPGDRFTEAEASAEYLIERGIPADAIMLENTGSSSQESLASVAKLLDAQGLDDVLIVTDPYHALRSQLIAEEVGLDAQVSSTDTSVVTGFDSFTRHVKEAGGVAVGRIIGFDRLSDIVD